MVKHRIWSRNRRFRNENTQLIWSPDWVLVFLVFGTRGWMSEVCQDNRCMLEEGCSVTRDGSSNTCSGSKQRWLSQIQSGRQCCCPESKPCSLWLSIVAKRNRKAFFGKPDLIFCWSVIGKKTFFSEILHLILQLDWTNEFAYNFIFIWFINCNFSALT